MPFIRLKTNKLIFIIVFLLSAVAFAAGGGGDEEKAADGEAKPDNKATSQADREWAKRTSKLNVYETKAKDLNKQLQDLIQKKKSGGKAVNEKGEPVDVLGEIVKAHAALKNTVHEYNIEKSELKYRYPEEGVVIDRRYVPLREQSLEQIENDMGLDAELTKTKAKIDRKYASFVGPEPLTPPPAPQPKNPESTVKDLKKKNDEPERIKFKK